MSGRRKVAVAAWAAGALSIVGLAWGCGDLPSGYEGKTMLTLTVPELPMFFVGDTVEIVVEARDPDGNVLADPSLAWSDRSEFEGLDGVLRAPPGMLWADSGRARFALQEAGDFEAWVTVLDAVRHFASDTVYITHPVEYLLTDFDIAGVGRDTTLESIGERHRLPITVLDRHERPVSFDLDLQLEHRGNAVVAEVLWNSRLAVESEAIGTDTVIVFQPDCHGDCADTVIFTVEQVPASIGLVYNPTIHALGDTVQPEVAVRDASSNLMPDYPVTWSYTDPADSVILELLDPSGRIASRGNGRVTFALTAGPVTMTEVFEVYQVADSVGFAEGSGPFQILGLDTPDTLTVVAWDRNGYPLPSELIRSSHIGWGPGDVIHVESSEDHLVVTPLDYGYAEARYDLDSGGLALPDARAELVVTVDADSIHVWPTADTIAVGDSTFMNVDAFVGDTVVAAAAVWTVLDPQAELFYFAGPVWGVSDGTVRIEGRAGSAVDTAVVVVSSGG